jgi:probable O-glycosylation ligase (exosortase A-associated)
MFALAPDMTWDRWDRTIKIMALGLCVPMTATSKERIYALVLVMVTSLAFFGVKGGLFTLLTGGTSHVIGPEGEGLGDNNALALALCLTLPLVNYVRIQSLSRTSRIVSAVAMILIVIAILGTYSRGGLIGLGMVGVYFLWKSRQRIAIAMFAVVALVAAFQFMPPQWLARMETIGTAQNDASFQDRLDAWQVALNIAAARPLIGGGLGASERSDIYSRFRSQGSINAQNAQAAGRSEPINAPRAYHSIYFQVLGDNGYPGLLLFLALLILTWRYLAQIRRATRGVAEHAWAFDLATMMQVSLFSYAVAGAGLSMAYYDMPYLFMGIAIAIRQIVRGAKIENSEPQLRHALVAELAGRARWTGLKPTA